MFHFASKSKNNSGRSAFTLIELLVVIAIIAILAAILFPVFGRARENARRSNCTSNLKQLSLAWLQYTQDYDEKAVPTYWQSGPTSNPIYHFFHGTGPYGGPFEYTDSPMWPYMKNASFTACSSANYTTAADYGMTDYGYNMAYVGGLGPAGDTNRFKNAPNFATMAKEPANIAKIADASRTFLFGETAMTGTTYVQRWPWLYPPSIGTTLGAINFRHMETANMAFVDGHVKAMKMDVLSSTAKGQLRGNISGTPGNPLSDAMWNGTGEP